MMNFYTAFDLYIRNRQVIDWGFQQSCEVLLPNGYLAYPGGYFTTYDNGYRLISSGATLGETDIQEIMILDPEGMPIARDTEDFR